MGIDTKDLSSDLTDGDAKTGTNSTSTEVDGGAGAGNGMLIDA